MNYSHYISKKIGLDYTYLANVFSEVYGTTIEKYMIASKIDYVKKLIGGNDLNLSEIADYMHYGSVAHLSAQFKKVTGLSPSHFRKLGVHQRRPLDEVGK